MNTGRVETAGIPCPAGGRLPLKQSNPLVIILRLERHRRYDTCKQISNMLMRRASWLQS